MVNEIYDVIVRVKQQHSS